jgi:hypothetical protein
MICISLVGERTRRSLAVALVVMAAALIGCKGSSDPLVPTATVPQATTTTNPYAVPPVIDEAYVNKVLAGLDHAVGDVTRQVLLEGSVGSGVKSRLAALYVADVLPLKITLFETVVQRGLSGYKENPGDRRSVVTELISVRPTCIFVRILSDGSEVVKLPDPRVAIQWVALVPRTDADSQGYNPTPWVFAYEGFDQGFAEPEDPCLVRP